MITLKRLFFKLIGKTPADMEMVRYWKQKGAVEAKVMTVNGVTVMQMEGEKYLFPGFPRGYLLFGKLSKLKHEIKNQIFNDSWAKLESGDTKVVEHVNSVLPNIYELFEGYKYDVLPPENMVSSVREIHRAWTKVNPDSKLRDIVCFIFQEDDAYRFRFQWMASYFGTGNAVQKLKRGLTWMEDAEIIGDMKERVRLIRRIMLEILIDPKNKYFLEKLFREINWNRVKLTKADKYFFRGKYFKVDFDKFDY